MTGKSALPEVWLARDAFDLNRLTLPEQVADKIESMILSDAGRLAGKLPSEQSLATAFSVSRTVIREALVILRARGLIVKTNGTQAKVNSGRGTANLDSALKLMIRLRNIKPQEIYEVRCALETMAVGLAATRHRPEEIQHLERLLKEMESVQDDFQLRTELELKFHRKIIEMSGNVLLTALAETLFTLLAPIVRDILAKIGVTEDADLMHRKIFKAIKENNPDAATDQMRVHLALFVRNLEI